MGFWTFVFAISALSIVAGLVNNWIKARHGYPLPEENCRRGGRSQHDSILAENRELKARLAEVTDRLAVLERIATDPAERVSREIEKLR
jgi:hypothetical protein